MGIIAVFSTLWVLMLISSTADARVINKRAAFYIANDTMCIVDGELYFNGDPVPTDDHCEKCTCRPPGFSCVLRDCEAKPGCKAVRKDGECCPDYICGCSHNGNVYKDGDFIRDLQNPCYTCRCHGSSISCTFADCLFRSDCGPEYIQGECCPRYDHCPPLSTTQKSTTVITTVPITYDEITKPLFNLTSPPHERLATHTTIFPTTGTITAGAGDAHTTETYVKTTFKVVSSDEKQTTRVHDSTVKPSSESSTSHTTQGDISTVTTFDSKKVTETSLDFDKDGTQKAESLDEETVSTESFSTDTTHWATDVNTEPEAKDFITTHSATELSSEKETFTEELHDGQTTESVTEVSHDRQTDVSFTEVSHDDAPLTGVPHDDKEDESETEFSSGSQTTELVTEVPHDRQTHESFEESSVDSITDHTSHQSDETVSVPFSDETSGSTFAVTKEDESKDTATSVEDILETTTAVLTTHEEFKISSEDEVRSSHEAFSQHPEVVGGSEGTSPASLSTVTMSGDSDTEVSTVMAFTTTTETRDITSPDTHIDTAVGNTSTTTVQNITTQGIGEDVVEGSTALTSHDDPQTESELENKTTFTSPEHSDFGNNEPPTIQSETESHSFSTQSPNDDDDGDGDSTDELHIDEDEISIQDAEELNLFFGAVTPTGESHLPSGEVTRTQTVTNELAEEESVDATKVIEDHLQTEHTEATDSDVDHTGSDSHSPVQGTTTTHSIEVPDPTQLVLHSGETTTSESVYGTSSNLQDETTISENNEDAEKFLSSLFTDIPESSSDIFEHTTKHLPDEVHPLSEVVEETDVEEQGTAHDNNEVPHLLSDSVNALSPTDELNTEGEQIHAGTEGSSQSSLIVTTEGTTEAMITMEAESDLSLTTSEDTSTMSGEGHASTTSSRATEHSEDVSEFISITHSAETPFTLTSSPEASSSAVHESTSEHVTEDDVSTKPTEHELLSEKFHITVTVPSEQDTSVFNKNSDIALSTTEISLDDLDHSDQHTEVHSIISEAEEAETSESSTLVMSDDNSETAPSPEDSNDGERMDISSTTRSAEIGSTSPNQIMDESMLTDAHDENAATSTVFTSDSFIKAEEPDTQQNTSVDELTADSQRNAGSQTTENTSEITMDAEESIVNNGFESITDYVYTTENDERSYVSTTQDHASVSKEDGESHSHYTIDGETYSAPNAEHIRTSRSTSNSMPSSITVQYPEGTEFKTGHTSETERENTGAPVTTGISVSAFDNTVVISDENKPVTENLYAEKSVSSVQENSLESTHSTYLNSVEVSSLSFELSNENLPTTPNSDDSYNNQVTKLITYEAGSPNGADIELNVHDVEGTSEDEPGEVPVASTDEVFPSTEPTPDLVKNNIAPDLILPIEHHVNAVPFNSVETENSILSDHSTGVTDEHVTNPSTLLTPKITSTASDLDSAETENEHSSESYDENNAFETENDEDDISRFSPTSERYAAYEANAETDLSASTTENIQTVSSYTLDAEAETAYFDDSTENSKEHRDHSVNSSPWNIQLSSEMTNLFDSENGQTPPESEDDELIGKEFQNGPEKGGEWFEPTVPVLSVINVHKVKDTTGTSADIQTSVQYATATDVKETTAPEKEENSSFETEMVDQKQKSTDIDNTHSSTLGEEQHGKSTTSSSDIRYFTNDIAKEEADTKSEAPSSTFASYETTHLGAADDLEHNTHQFFYTSLADVDLNTNVPTTDETHENDAEATVTAKTIVIGYEENESSSERSNDASSSKHDDFYDKEVEEDEFTGQTAVDGITHENTIKPDPSDESTETRTTSKTNFISQRDEIEAFTTSKIEDATENAELREQKDAKEESQHEVQNLGSGTTKESSIFLNDFMLSDGTGSMTHFTDAITDGADIVTDHFSTTEHGAEHEEPGKSLQNVGSEGKFHTNPEQNDKDLYLKEGNEENASEGSTTAKVHSNELTESEQSEEVSTDEGHHFEKNTENCVSVADHTEGLSDENDHDHSTEASSSFYKSTTPLPLVLFNEFVEKLKEDNLVNQNSQAVEEHHSTVQPEAITEEVESDEKIKEDLEKELDSDHQQISDDKISTTTRRNSIEHDADPTTPTSDYQEKQTEIYSTSPQTEEFSNQNSYSTENSYFDYSPGESEEVTDSSRSSQVTQQNNNSSKNVSRVFFMRRSHDDDSLNEESPQKKEEHTVEKDDVRHSVKATEIDANGQNDASRVQDELAVTTEEVISQQDEGSTDGTHDKDFSESDSDSSPTSRSSVEPTSTVNTNVKHVSGFSSNERLDSESTEVAQNSEDEEVKDAHNDDDVSGLKTTPNSVNSDTA